jgi:hypothetical protein
MKKQGFVFRKGMDVKISNRREGVSVMRRGIITATDWPFVSVKIDGSDSDECFFRNDVFPLHYYTC